MGYALADLTKIDGNRRGQIGRSKKAELGVRIVVLGASSMTLGGGGHIPNLLGVRR